MALPWISLAWALTLDASIVGDELVIDVGDAVPSSTVFVAHSTDGLGVGPCPPALGGLCLDLLAPTAKKVTVDALGEASLVVAAPSGPDRIWLQAAAPGEVSAPVEVSLVPEVLSLDCTAVDNVLRHECVVLLDRPAPAQLRVLDGDGNELFYDTHPDPAEAHSFVTFGTWADDVFSVRAQGEGGAPVAADLVTGSLPPGADLQLDVLGSTDAGPFLFNMGCTGTDVLVVADGEGRVRWYQDVASLGAGAVVSRGIALTPHGTVLVLVDRYQVSELGFDGTVHWSTPVTDPVHHEVLWWNGQVMAMDARPVLYPNGVTYMMDGVQWFDGTDGSPVGSVSSEVFVDPQVVLGGGGYWGGVFPGAVDWAHGNAVGMADDGTGVWSHKAIDTLQKVVLDPDAPDVGDLVWTLTGKGGAPLVTDLARTSSTGVTPITFGDQHHVTVLPDGDLLFFDNQPGGGSLSRVLRVAIDEVAGTADLIEAWPVNRDCPGQGSAELLDNGNVFADCAKADTLVEIEAGTGAELWSMEASCANGNGNPRPLYRALMVDW